MDDENVNKETLSELTLQFGDKQLEFSLATINDAWEEMLRMLLNFRVKEPDEVEQSEWEMIWYGNGSDGYVWRLKKINDDVVNLHIEYYDRIDKYENSEQSDEATNEVPDEDPEQETMFEGEIEIDQLILAIIHRVDAYLKSNSIISYSDEWHNFDFPITPYLRLKKYLIEKQLWKTETEAGDGFKNELEILLQ